MKSRAAIGPAQIESISPPGAGIQAQSLCHPDDRAAQSTPVITARPFIGVAAVLLGAIISTLNSRLTTFGLADVRGAVHAGFDEGAWIPTAFTVRANDDWAGLGLARWRLRAAAGLDDLSFRHL